MTPRTTFSPSIARRTRGGLMIILAAGLVTMAALQLREAGRPIPRPAATPAGALASAVQMAAERRRDGVDLYFADAGTAGRFFDQWATRLPRGTVRVARADEVNAGGENGHRIPVEVWLEGARVVGLRGEAQFVMGPQGARIAHLELQAIPLSIPTREDAARLLRSRLSTPVTPVTGPFYGRYRFAGAGRTYDVDAATGVVD
jgi:hypothetical protein